MALYKTLVSNLIGIINLSVSKNVELIFSILRLVTGKFTAAFENEINQCVPI